MSIKKPILDQIKETIANKDQIREQILQNIQTTRKIVEVQAKSLLEQTKQSKFFNEKVIPLVEGERADKALNTLNTRFNLKGTSVMKHLEKLRKDIVELKVEKAKEVTPMTVKSDDEKDTVVKDSVENVSAEKESISTDEIKTEESKI